MVDFGPMWCWPKPVSKPHPPVLLGGNGPNVLKRVIAYADEWMPNRGAALERIPELRQMEAESGHAHVPVSFYPRDTAADIERAAGVGVERCIFYVPADGRAPALTKLDALAKLIQPYK